MKLNSITLRNFKSIGEEAQTANLAPITLLFGPNSAGKSTILQALVFLREVIEHRNLDPDVTELGGEWLDLGGFKNLVHGRDVDTSIELKIDLSIDDYGLKDYLNHSDHEILSKFDLPFAEKWLVLAEKIERDRNKARKFSRNRAR